MLDDSLTGQPLNLPKDSAPLSLHDRFRIWKNSKIADPRFRALARRLPVLRGITNKNANALFQITAGFANSQILLACVQLDLFARLGKQPMTSQKLAPLVNLSPDATQRLLRAGRGLDLFFQDSRGQWRLGEAGTVINASPGIAAMVRHHAAVYRDLADPVALLRNPPKTTETSAFWAYVGAQNGIGIDAAEAEQYSDLMRISQDMVIDEVLDAYPLAKHKSLMDVGGGNGAFVTAAGKRNPALALHLFDLPAVANQIASRVTDPATLQRITAHGGSFFAQEIPPCADCYSLIRVLYDHDDKAAITILSNIRAAMKPGDTLLIGEPMADATKGGKLVEAYFGMYLLAMRSGRCRTADDHIALLKAAGFTKTRILQTKIPVVSGALIAIAQ